MLAIVLLVLVLVAVCLVCGSVGYLVARCLLVRRARQQSKPTTEASVHLMELQPSSPSGQYDLEQVKLGHLIARGGFARVYAARLVDDVVTVKVFASNRHREFLNEVAAYSRPYMQHQALPVFYGSAERPSADSGIQEYHMVLSYAPSGRLQDYLSTRTIDWPTFCRMSQTIASGLAHLHSELRRGHTSKPCIVHRDLSSRNILVKADGGCMIYDFSVSARISGSKCSTNGSEQLTETVVGAPRYMAPELLDGGLNLYDCEASLTQIDVYALGLILWELASRCSDLYQGMEAPPYKLPFEQEIGASPTLEQMQVLVTKHRARPLFPNIWKDTNPAVRQLKETIEESWDHDAEARLTALCVDQRLTELPLLWSRYKMGSLNVTEKGIEWQHKPNVNNQLNLLCLKSGTIGLLNGISNHLDGDKLASQWITVYNNKDNHSVNETNEPISRPPSDCEKNVILANYANQKQQQPQLTHPIHSYQGRNPCLERNLMLQTSDDGSGSKLLQRGFKFSTNYNNFDNFSAPSNGVENRIADESAALNLNLNGDQQDRRRLGYPFGSQTPIAIVQNAVNVGLPKQPNLPTNGHHSIANDGHSNLSSTWTSKMLRWTRVSNWKAVRDGRKATNPNNDPSNCQRCEYAGESGRLNSSSNASQTDPVTSLQPPPPAESASSPAFPNAYCSISPSLPSTSLQMDVTQKSLNDAIADVVTNLRL